MNEILIEYIQGQLLGNRGEVSLAVEDDLLRSGLVDSMGMMSLIGFIEKRFKVTVPPEDMNVENFVTVQAICNYLDRRKGTK